MTDIKTMQQHSEFLPHSEVIAMREKLSEPVIIQWIEAKLKDRVLRLIIKAITWVATYLMTMLKMEGII